MSRLLVLLVLLWSGAAAAQSPDSPFGSSAGSALDPNAPDGSYPLPQPPEPHDPWEAETMLMALFEVQGGGSFASDATGSDGGALVGARLDLLDLQHKGMAGRVLSGMFGYASDTRRAHAQALLAEFEGWFCGRDQFHKFRCQLPMDDEPIRKSQIIGFGGELLRYQYAGGVDAKQLRIGRLYYTLSLTDPFHSTFKNQRVLLIAGASADYASVGGDDDTFLRGAFGLRSQLRFAGPALQLRIDLIYQPILAGGIAPLVARPNLNDHAATANLHLTWRLMRRLRLTLQLRYDYNGQPELAWGQFTSTRRQHAGALLLGLKVPLWSVP